jgi:hypothetical protein
MRGVQELTYAGASCCPGVGERCSRMQAQRLLGGRGRRGAWGIQGFRYTGAVTAPRIGCWQEPMGGQCQGYGHSRRCCPKAHSHGAARVRRAGGSAQRYKQEAAGRWGMALAWEQRISFLRLNAHPFELSLLAAVTEPTYLNSRIPHVLRCPLQAGSKVGHMPMQPPRERSWLQGAGTAEGMGHSVIQAAYRCSASTTTTSAGSGVG